MTDRYLISNTALVLRDAADEPATAIDALVASGDCFITLATQLDALSQDQIQLQQSHPEIEHVIGTLVFLQRHYRIVKKPPNYRQ